MKKILVSAPIDFLPDLKDEICNLFEATFAYHASKEETISLLNSTRFSGWLVSPCPTYFIDSALLSYCKSIKIISTPSTGSNHIDVDSLKAKGIKIYSLKGSRIINKITASSEFTFNLILSVIRKTPYAFNSARNGEWRNIESQLRGREMSGLKIGIVGYGRIGKNVARYCKAFKMNVSIYDPFLKIGTEGVKQYESLSKMLNFVDIVLISVHLNKQTYGMINNDMFREMKDGVYFINTSRGDVVNEKDLLQNLKNNKILAAGLDVISNEYTENIKDHPIIKYAKNNDNLLLTPHIAGLTYDSERKAQKSAFDAIKEFLI